MHYKLFVIKTLYSGRIYLEEFPWLKCWITALNVSESELQSCYYIHLQTNILGKGIKPLIPTKL